MGQAITPIASVVRMPYFLRNHESTKAITKISAICAIVITPDRFAGEIPMTSETRNGPVST